MEWHHILLIALGSAAALLIAAGGWALCRMASLADEAAGGDGE